MASGKPKLRKSATLPEMSGIKHPLPPAVLLVDSKGYIHSKKVKDYLIGGTLGEGSFAKVKEAFHELVGEKVAMKIIDKKKALEDAYVAKNFKREARLLQKLNHPNIIKLYQVIETDNNYYLITELCSGGELTNYIYKNNHLSEEETRKFVRQIVSAIDHLHKAGIIHRDLKAGNLMLDDKKNIKLIDFGLSNEEISLDDSGNEVHCKTQCGSPAYAAPELLGQREYDKGVDIWSIGINMYAMLTGCLPFLVEPLNITVLHAKMLQNKMNPIPDWISDNCRDLLKRMLVAKPEERITMDEIFHHPWLNEDLKLPFTPEPYPNRLSAHEINEAIVEHMSTVLNVGIPMAIKQDLVNNKATPFYAIYHLLHNRLTRYEREYSSRITKTHERKAAKKKLSKDHGFYDDEDSSDASSTVTAPVTIGRRHGGSGGVVLRQRRTPLSKNRPTSDDITYKTLTMPGASGGRRLSDIFEERRRSSVPEDVLKKQLDQMKEKRLGNGVLNRTTVSPMRHKRVTHPQLNTTLPAQFKTGGNNFGVSEMSPPNDPCEFDLNHTYHPKLTRFSSPTGKRSLPRDLNKIGHSVNTAAWGSNPPSRAGSRQSSFSTMPPITKNRSFSMESSDIDDLDFHDVSTPKSPDHGGVSFFTDTPPPFSEHSNPDLHLPTLGPPTKPNMSLKKSPRRRNGWVVPTNGDCIIKTDMQVGGVIGELLRTAHEMRMKSEPQLANTVRCEHKAVMFEIGVRKTSVTSCTLHFEWLAGGSHRQFNEVCAEVLQRAHL